MEFINKIDGASVWMRQSGIYFAADLYRRGEVLFAKKGSGYIRLGIGGATSCAKMTWLEIDPAGSPVMLPKGAAPSYKLSSSASVKRISSDCV